MNISKRSRKKVKKLKPKPKTVFLIPSTLLIIILLIYVLNFEIPLPYINYVDIIIGYQNLNTSITLYKIYTFNIQKDTVLSIGTIIKEVNEDNHRKELYIDLGVHKIRKGVEITFTNYTSYTILDGGRRYLAYLKINNTYTGIPIAYIDAGYSRSFDSIVNYHPYQLHFILRVQKCGMKIDLGNLYGVNKIVLKVVNEDGSTKIINIDGVVNRSCFLNICGDRIEVETYLSPIWFLTVKQSQTKTYLVLGESPLIILMCSTPLLYILIKSFVKSRTVIKKV